MDLAAEELATHLSQLDGVEGLLIRPPMRLARARSSPSTFERGIGRFVQLPAELAALRLRADYYHIADHSYAHLALMFPAERVGIYCHDIDAFRALLPGATASRGHVMLSRLLLRGLRHARLVFHSTQAVRGEILKHGLLPDSKLVQAPFGIASEFLAHRPSDSVGPPYLLHVGSCIPRKNIEFLLKLFAVLHQSDSGLKLLQIGGSWTDQQRRIIEHHGLESSITQRRGLSRSELAGVYAASSAVLVPSLAEGFGFPVIEALACGAPVVASDIAVLREVGCDEVRFCAPSAVDAWASAINEIRSARLRPSQQTRDTIQRRYAWQTHAALVSSAYLA